MRRWVIGAVVAFVCSPVWGEPVPKDLVRASVVADAAGVAAGEAFRVGVILKMKPGWHVYWENPGDSGAATVVKFSAPRGVTVSELRWPVPVKFEQPGELVGYGYEGEVMLSAVVKVPAGVRVGESITVNADVEWLVCEKVCVPGEAKLSVTVPVKEKTVAANTDLFETWEKRLAGERLPDVKVNAIGALEGGNRGEFAITVEAKEPLAKVEFFPVPESALSVEDVVTAVEGRTGKVTFDARVLAGQKLSSDVLRGVVAVTDRGGERRGVAVAVPLGGTK
jgi:thiol:disulfide interchange protein DsbD